MQRWLHQHIFKVGWLITRDFQTTTILYYTLFLPGVLLYEIVYWLAAGILNVRAEGAIKWPEKQEIGELRLNFVRLSKKANPFRVAVIASAPLLVGILFIWLISNNVLDVRGVLETAGMIGEAVRAADVVSRAGDALGLLLSKPDFWLWFYLMFAIGNTLLPDTQALRGWRILVPMIVVTIIVLILLGVADEIFLAALSGPLSNGLVILSTTLLTVVIADAAVIALLSLIENTIERVTGRSAAFKNGKMITMTRAERLAQREQQIRKERERIERARQSASAKIPAGPPSIYHMALPILGPPGQETITPAAISIEPPKPAPQIAPTSPATAPSGAAQPVRPMETARAGASVITGSAVSRSPLFPQRPVEDKADSDKAETEENEEKQKTASRSSTATAAPFTRPAAAQSEDEDAEEEDEDDIDEDEDDEDVYDDEDEEDEDDEDIDEEAEEDEEET